ncbi:helicase associated domain-containing protein [Arthrobacter sp. B0490]|uniref:helicase associated domain-containing protein n=1 Tax=Arthrobacter sp. B0490 TaxID=2058891 RepID=UPI000CE4141B|nr:helicase associated domain-containing protein [Arthrobacter sp. B0490]
MRFDDLILAGDEYPQGACESRQEWLLMYSRGVPPAVIAGWCRVDVRRVRRTIDRQIGLDQGWFGRCWVLHDQPAPSSNRRRFRRSREQVWWEHHTAMATYVARVGGLPAQNDSLEARVLYRWLENQRRTHDAGRLTQDKVDALNRLGEWIGTRKGNPDELWVQRLKQVQHFRDETGRFPIYDPQRHPDEKVLAVWLGRQRTWQRNGRLRADRQKILDQVLSGWDRVGSVGALCTIQVRLRTISQDR